jgi:hypothetical protein
MELSHYDLSTPFPHPLLAYAASMVISLAAAENFIKAEKPHFNILLNMPALTIGANALSKITQDLLSSTNRPFLNLLLGGLTDGISGSPISVDDFAKLHVLALNPNIPVGRYLASTGREGARVLPASILLGWKRRQTNNLRLYESPYYIKKKKKNLMVSLTIALKSENSTCFEKLKCWANSVGNQRNGRLAREEIIAMNEIEICIWESLNC